ncbi:hypothetical protein HaLaN_24449 [Haematococcus lacustris]|uniref:Uncharacterized protein n=1 Tax=Haematococcus lacustris TaxID=44745 RepID=A0A6A0A3E6_HAELA|nr:hypothetical protein HaLaN_24449 [Haematococcus lacustris]
MSGNIVLVQTQYCAPGVETCVHHQVVMSGVAMYGACNGHCPFCRSPAGMVASMAIGVASTGEMRAMGEQVCLSGCLIL